MADVFEEVEGELRAARYQTLLQRGWPFALGALVVVLLVVLGVWGYGKHTESEQAKASIAYSKGLEALAGNDLAGADGKFAALAASAPAGYRTLALMQEAGIRVAQKKPADAARLFDQAAKTAPDNILGDAARLKAAYLLMDSAPVAEIEARLTPLTAEKHPYALMAREALGLARLQAGKTAAARSDFAVLSLSQDVSPLTRARAQAALALIQAGSASAIPSAVKLAAAIPTAPIAARPTPEQAGAAQ